MFVVRFIDTFTLLHFAHNIIILKCLSGTSPEANANVNIFISHTLKGDDNSEEIAVAGFEDVSVVALVADGG